VIEPWSVAELSDSKSSAGVAAPGPD
jgi:hypothetical protein